MLQITQIVPCDSVMNSNMMMADCGADPLPRMSFQGEADVMATVAVMLLHVNECVVQDMLSVTWSK